MGGFFKLDGPFFKYGTILADMFILTFLWLICSIPLITIGTALTAVFYVTTRQISDREGYVTANFFKSFKENFLQSTFTTIVILLVAIILYISMHWAHVMGDWKEVILTLEVIAAFELFITSIYIFPLISRFDMKFIETFRIAFFLANRHIITTFTCAALLAALLALAFFLNPMFLFCGIGAYAYISSYMFMKVFKNYCSTIDNDANEQ